MNGKGRFSIVIPVVPQHEKYVASLIKELQNEEELVGEIIIARSAVKSLKQDRFQRRIDKLVASLGIPFPIIHLPTIKRNTAGQNRNRGWSIARFEYVCFLDADDSYSGQRLTLINDCIEKFHPDLILHSFLFPKENFRLDNKVPEGSRLLFTEELYRSTFPEGLRERNLEGLRPGDTNLELPKDDSNVLRIHHGHIVVRTDLRDHFAYSDLRVGEDGQLCRDILHSKRKVVYLPLRLSVYNQHLSSSLTFLSLVTRVVKTLIYLVSRLMRQSR